MKITWESDFEFIHVRSEQQDHGVGETFHSRSQEAEIIRVNMKFNTTISGYIRLSRARK